MKNHHPTSNRSSTRKTAIDSTLALPRYEIRARQRGAGDSELEVWQLPSPATPRLTGPVRIAGLHGRNLEMVENRVMKRLKTAGVQFEPTALRFARQWPLPEELALTLGLLFRALAPMRSRDNLRAVVEGIEAMGKEEASYWLGMAMHRKNPRRVLAALRMLLSTPRKMIPAHQ
jgi:hypothetical protein